MSESGQTIRISETNWRRLKSLKHEGSRLTM